MGVYCAFVCVLYGEKSSAILNSHECPKNDRVNSSTWKHHNDANKASWEKARQELYKNATSHFEQFLEVTSHKAAALRPPTSHLYNLPNMMDKTCGTLLDK